MRKAYLPAVMLLLLLYVFMPTSVTAQGYYKDVFMDGGIKLTSRTRLPAADFLNLSIEYFASERYTSTFPPTLADTLRQNELIVGSARDINGILLYPDGAPRFRVIYTNGGKAASHGGSLGEKGRNRYRSFVKEGGGYVGSCAGAYLCSKGTIKADTVFLRDNYLAVWPGVTKGTGLLHNSTGLFVEKKSPLLKYYDFGGDHYIDSVRHNGGCFAFSEEQFPAKTEILLRYDYDVPRKTDIHKKINAWAYKKDNKSGRVVVTGSHPESVTGGERLEMMAALLSYGMDGNGEPAIKGLLKNGKKRAMYKTTLDNDPDFTMIGDKQYHHFFVNIPSSAKNISVVLSGANGYDLFLYCKKDGLAFRGESDYTDISLGAEKQINFDSLDEGKWYIGVECNTTVETIRHDWGYEYSGKTEVLNGVPYYLVVTWDK